MLSNPAKATRSNLDGITYVASRMNWYSALIEHLLGTDNTIMDGSFESVLQRLEGKVIELYKAILLYQMKSVCSYYKCQGLVFLQGLIILPRRGRVSQRIIIPCGDFRAAPQEPNFSPVEIELTPWAPP